MHKYLILLASLFSNYYLIAQNKTDRVASYLNSGQNLQSYYSNPDYYPDFTKSIDSFKKTFTFIINFRVDTLGKVTALNVYEEEKPIPKAVKEFATNLILKTSGYWQPEVKNCKEVLSDTISCLIRLRPKGKTQWQKMAEADEGWQEMEKKGVDYFTFELNSKIRLFDIGKKNHCFIFIEY